MVSVLIFFLAGASQSFDAAYRAGLIALQQNQLAEAQSNLEIAAKLAPSNARTWVALADVYLRLNKQADAAKSAEKAEALAPSDPLVSHTLAIFYSETGRPLKAAQLEARYALETPSDKAAPERAAAWYFAAAEPLLKQQKFADVLRILEPAHEKLPSNAQLELALGVAYYGLRRFDEAAAAFLKTVDLAPEERQPYVFLGRMLDQAPARLADAAPKFAAFRKAHPDDELGYFLEAKVLDAQKTDPDRARELLEKATAISPSDAAAHLELGILDEKTQRFPDAASELERAATLDVSNPVIHYHLSRVYDRLGQPDRARAERETHAKLVAAEDTVR